MNNKEYEITASLYKGVMIGFRIYEYMDGKDFAFYLPFVNFALIIYKQRKQ